MGKHISVNPSKIAKFHTDKAIREGRLHEYCFGTYGEEYVKETFCPQCSHSGICKREIEARASNRGQGLKPTCS